MEYCKSWNIRGTLIFANFAQNSASANSKTRKNICNILYAHFGHVGVVYWPCVLMQMGNILENVWGLFCFCAAQLLVMYRCMMSSICATQISSEYLLSVNLTTREYVFVLTNVKNLSREINSVYSSLFLYHEGRNMLVNLLQQSLFLTTWKLAWGLPDIATTTCKLHSKYCNVSTDSSYWLMEYLVIC